MLKPNQSKWMRFKIGENCAAKPQLINAFMTFVIRFLRFYIVQNLYLDLTILLVLAQKFELSQTSKVNFESLKIIIQISDAFWQIFYGISENFCSDDK